MAKDRKNVHMIQLFYRLCVFTCCRHVVTLTLDILVLDFVCILTKFIAVLGGGVVVLFVLVFVISVVCFVSLDFLENVAVVDDKPEFVVCCVSFIDNVFEVKLTSGAAMLLVVCKAVLVACVFVLIVECIVLLSVDCVNKLASVREAIGLVVGFVLEASARWLAKVLVDCASERISECVFSLAVVCCAVEIECAKSVAIALVASEAVLDSV